MCQKASRVTSSVHGQPQSRDTLVFAHVCKSMSVRVSCHPARMGHS